MLHNNNVVRNLIARAIKTADVKITYIIYFNNNLYPKPFMSNKRSIAGKLHIDAFKSL